MLESELVKKLEPYECGEQPRDKKYVKLNTNENPFILSSEIIDKMSQFNFEDFRRYSDPNNLKLKEAIVNKFKESFLTISTKNIFVGNGSDEILALCFAAFFSEKQPIILADITYSFYPVYAQLWNKRIKIVKLKKNFRFDFNKAIKYASKASGIVIANPNAPTSLQENKDDIIELLKSFKDKPVIVDEAYVDFAGYNTVDLLNEFDNLIIVRTFSKSYALAGARCGFALASEAAVGLLETVKNSFNSYTVNSYTEKVATLALEDDAWFNKMLSVINIEKKFLYKNFKEIGFIPLKSNTNFIFVDVSPAINAQTLYVKLKERGVLVRYFNKERISNYLRITIGTHRDNEILINTIKNIIKEDSYDK